jgi:putative selenate reductase
MAELIPLPFGRLATRMFRELERDGAIFDLERDKFFLGDPAHELSIDVHGHPAATPLGPAAGPHSQLAQNLVLSFLGGGRVFELKTVQLNDTLEVPRPCIDMATVGYNVEWSQELRLEQSLEEYAKASMLIELLVASGRLNLAPGAERTVFDMSVGYDLAGIRSERVRAFISGMKDCSAVVERLRKEIPAEFAQYRDLPFTTRLSDTLTLSTFHGCPPDEIERITDHLLREHGLHCVVKLNPTLLGATEARRIFHDALGYAERIPDEAFTKDAQWSQAIDIVGRLGDTAKSLGRGLGVKFSNTLLVENHREFFPKSERVMYLSGPPLHVLAMTLVARFRDTFGDRFPVSFSAGIDRQNFADAVSLGLVPVTVCSDLLRAGGYGRMRHYFANLAKRMSAAGARDVDEWVLRGQGLAEVSLDAAANGADVSAARAALAGKGDLRAAAGPALHARWLSEARVRNARLYAEKALADPRYASAANSKSPNKVGSKLWLFECLTCDKCVPVCPNDANFAFTLPKGEIAVTRLRGRAGGGFDREDAGTLRIEKQHQLANYADFCNECGNCDVFCPEDGGPYLLKPRFFGTEESFARFSTRDGFHVTRAASGDTVLARFEGKALRLVLTAGRAVYSGDGFEVRFAAADPVGTLEGRIDPDAVVDLAHFRIMDSLRTAVLDGPGVNYVNS